MNEIAYNVIKAIRETEVAQAFNRAVQDYDRNGGEDRKTEMFRADEILRVQLKEAAIKIIDRSQEETDKGQMTVWMFRENGMQLCEPWRVSLAGFDVRRMEV
jgi:hypothetical protein